MKISILKVYQLGRGEAYEGEIWDIKEFRDMQGWNKVAPGHTNFKLTVLRDYWELSEQIRHAFRSG